MTRVKHYGDVIWRTKDLVRKQGEQYCHPYVPHSKVVDRINTVGFDLGAPVTCMTLHFGEVNSIVSACKSAVLEYIQRVLQEGQHDKVGDFVAQDFTR